MRTQNRARTFSTTAVLAVAMVLAPAQAQQAPEPPQAEPAAPVEPTPPSAAPVEPTPPSAAPVEPGPPSAAPPPSPALPPSIAPPPSPAPAFGADIPAGDALEFGAVAVAPTPGARIRIEKVPRNVQQLDAATVERERALSLPDVLNARLGSATLNHVQNNPLQPDLQYRGFTASPLLGSAQGLSVYQNGVRVNDAFGEVVQWDIVPEFAVSELQLIPGANPIYGWNALGGALVLRMKDGFRNPGHRIEALAGSFARRQVSAEYGRAVVDDWAVYAGASVFGEQGFRDESRSRARTLYADVRHRTLERELGVNLTLTDTDLNGNGLSPVELLERDRSAVFTFPDNTRNELLMVASDLDQRLGEHVAVQGTAYLRALRRLTLNGDEGEFELCPEPGGGALQVLCEEEGELLRSETEMLIATSEPFDGLFNTTRTLSAGYGGSLQLSLSRPLLARENQLVLGASYDGSQVDFLQRAELGRLTKERTVQGAHVFLADEAFRTDLRARNRNLGVYASDTFSITPRVAINLSARFNWANIEIDDRMGDALEGDHSFSRVNPAAGVTYTPIDALTLFAGYGESSRAPSASELACADPDEPCRVPNAFVADPPLDQVVSRSIELGARGFLGGDRRRSLLAWSLAGFASRNFDDILFVAGSRVGTGYFRNAGQTQRWGLELAGSGDAGPLRWYASYALLRATFESELELPGGAHPLAETQDNAEPAPDDGDDAGGVIEVEPGDRIPGLPVHSAKAGVFVSPIEALELGLTAIAQSARPFRGDEANLLPELGGYVILGARATYALFPQLDLFIKAENLLDAEYETFGAIADPSEVLPQLDDPRFLGPGAPLGVWAGIVVHGS